MKKIFVVCMMVMLVVLGGCGTSEQAKKIVGEWELDVVKGTKDGKVIELDRENHNSYYGDGTHSYVIEEGGTFTLHQTDGTGNTYVVGGEWKEQNGAFILTSPDNKITFTYDSASDTLHQVIEEAEGEYSTLDFVYKRK